MDTKTIFEQMARHYDTEERVRNARIIAEKVNAELSDTQGKTALDYGCGTGLIGLALAERFESMLLVDASPQMIERVAAKIKEMGIHNARTLIADFAERAVDVKADYILLSQVLLHVKNYEALLKTLLNTLNDGGHLILIDFDRNELIDSDLVHNGFDQNELIELLTDMGYASARAETFYHGEKMFMKQDASLFFLEAIK